VTAAISDGFLLVDKAKSWTSHDVVAKVRNVTGQRKVGHAGTLDPMATGLLVLGVGRGTRLLRFVQDAPKSYTATARFGVATESLDADGAVLSREPMPVEARDVDQVIERFTGSILQVPPMVSALKVEGRRLYELAREGKTVEREARRVEIHELDLVDFAPSDYPEATFTVRCSKGTYIRTLADDIARALGGRAHLTALRRTAIGSLSVDRASSVDEIATSAAAEPGGWSRLLIDLADGLGDLPALEVTGDLVRAVSNGVPIAGSHLGVATPGPLRIVDHSGRLLAVYRSEGARASAEVVVS
jgi:tRNA pseudouridine55 synthase